MIQLTKASLNCQKVGFIRSLKEEGRAARTVQAVLGEKKQNNKNVLNVTSSASLTTVTCTKQWKFQERDAQQRT